MTDFKDVVDLYAELALALAGFAGVASAFAGRERSFRPVERLRLIGVVALSASVLGGCLAYTSALVASLSERSAGSIAGLVSFILISPLFPVLRQLWRRARDPDATVDSWSLYLVTTLQGCETLLLLLAILGFVGQWPLATAFSLQLLQGLWLFYLLLTRQN